MNSAVSAYSKAVSLDPFVPEALAALGAAYMRQGNYEAALPVFSNFVDLRPDDLPGLLNLARTLTGLQRPCEAVPLLQKARDLDRNPSHWARLDQSLADLRGRCDKSRPPAR
jgi:tetratricopeptide (TPR) repeat protein